MITFSVEVIYDNAYVRFTKPAPELPQGVVWQKGIVFDDETDCIEISAVVVSSSGDVRLECEETYSADWSQQSIDSWIDAGWTLVYSAVADAMLAERAKQ